MTLSVLATLAALLMLSRVKAPRPPSLASRLIAVAIARSTRE